MGHLRSFFVVRIFVTAQVKKAKIELVLWKL